MSNSVEEAPRNKKFSSVAWNYRNKGLTCPEEFCRRHSKGYDPLDRLLQEARSELKEKKAARKASKSTLKMEYKQRVRELLREHIETMAEAGIVFHHTFCEQRLGLSVALARYGEEGREFVSVEETNPCCELYSLLKPTDELIAVNGKIILEPTKDRFDDLRIAIKSAPRPIELTFIQGERREEAFNEQEERRKMAALDIPSSS